MDVCIHAAQDVAADDRRPSSLSTSRCASRLYNHHHFHVFVSPIPFTVTVWCGSSGNCIVKCPCRRRSTISSATAPTLLSDVPEDDSCSTTSWYCDPAYSISSLASRRARRAAGRASLRSGSLRSSGTGDGMSTVPDAGSSRSASSAVSVPAQSYPTYLYQALPFKMPQTDRLARWRCASCRRIDAIQRTGDGQSLTKLIIYNCCGASRTAFPP